MKPSMLGLLIAAGAFGASTIYLAMQLDEERTRADEVAELTRKLNGRIAELERMQADFESLRLGADSAGVSEDPGTPGPSARVAATQPAPLADGRPVNAAEERFDGPGLGPPRSEAMQRMVRTQLRANFKRLYSDLGEQLGLGQEQANQLIDLLVDQQLALADMGRRNAASTLTPEQRSAAMAEQNQKNLAAVSELIGADKVDQYKAYQDTVPARREVDQLSRQLEAHDVALSDDQRDRMVVALAEERKRVPQPRIAESVSREEYNSAMAAWQEDYQQRTATRAGSILTSEQQKAYDEFQQLQKEMRQQFEARRAAREARAESAQPR